MKVTTLHQNVESYLLKVINKYYINQLIHINKVNLRNNSNDVKK